MERAGLMVVRVREPYLYLGHGCLLLVHQERDLICLHACNAWWGWGRTEGRSTSCSLA